MFGWSYRLASLLLLLFVVLWEFVVVAFAKVLAVLIANDNFNIITYIVSRFTCIVFVMLVPPINGPNILNLGVVGGWWYIVQSVYVLANTTLLLLFVHPSNPSWLITYNIIKI